MVWSMKFAGKKKVFFSKAVYKSTYKNCIDGDIVTLNHDYFEDDFYKRSTMVNKMYYDTISKTMGLTINK